MTLKKLKQVINAIPEKFDNALVVLNHSELSSTDELSSVVVIPANLSEGTLYTDKLGIIDLSTYDKPLISLINNGY